MRARILTIVNVIHFMLLVQSSSNDLRRKLKCDSYDWHPNAKEGYEDVDIFKPSDSHLKAESVEASQPVLEDAVRYVKSHVNSTIAELATLDPTYSNCTWLKTQLIDRAGLGHTFACWANYLKMSIENGLTLHYPFYSSDHEVCNLNDTTHFFGLHSAFYWGREPPQDAVVIDVGSQRKGDCDSKRLAIAMQNYTSINGSFSCAKGHVVFKCFNHEVDFQTRFVKSFDGVQLPVRAAFSASFKRHGPNHRHPLVDAAKKNNELVIVAHMRRGDILESRKIDKDHRLVSFGVYQSMFRELLKARMFYALNSTSSLQPVHFFILCEGAPDKDHVVEYEVQGEFCQHTGSFLCDHSSLCYCATVFNRYAQDIQSEHNCYNYRCV